MWRDRENRAGFETLRVHAHTVNNNQTTAAAAGSVMRGLWFVVGGSSRGKWGWDVKDNCGSGTGDCGLNDGDLAQRRKGAKDGGGAGSGTTDSPKDLECLRPHEVAAKLKISREHVMRLLRSKKLPGFKMGGVWLVHKRELEEYLRRLLDAARATTTNRY